MKKNKVKGHFIGEEGGSVSCWRRQGPGLTEAPTAGNAPLYRRQTDTDRQTQTEIHRLTDTGRQAQTYRHRQTDTGRQRKLEVLKI